MVVFFDSIDQLPHTREEYGASFLDEQTMHDDPLEQFKIWFDQHAKLDDKTPNAMVLSTVDHNNQADSRVVLLKELDKSAFVFYTHYSSVKGSQMAVNASVALNFYWSMQARQVRVRGLVHQLSPIESDTYFASRPRESQLSAIISSQSVEISGRDCLERAYQQLDVEYANKPIIRPECWGGYAVVPNQIEFWQGRDNRLHDRIQYIRQDAKWRRRRLAP